MKNKETVYLCVSVSESYYAQGSTPQEAWEMYRSEIDDETAIENCDFYKAVKIEVKHEVKEVLTEK